MKKDEFQGKVRFVPCLDSISAKSQVLLNMKIRLLRRRLVQFLYDKTYIYMNPVIASTWILLGNFHRYYSAGKCNCQVLHGYLSVTYVQFCSTEVAVL